MLRHDRDRHGAGNHRRIRAGAEVVPYRAASCWSGRAVQRLLGAGEPRTSSGGRAFEIETTPPLYYTLLKPWAAAFGSGELAPVVLGRAVGSDYSAGLSAGARIRGPGALLAAAIFALTPMQIHFAQEARAYALLPLLFTWRCSAWCCSAGGAGAGGRGAGPVRPRGIRAGLRACDLGLHPGGAGRLRRAGCCRRAAGAGAALPLPRWTLVVVLAIPEITRSWRRPGGATSPGSSSRT